MLFKPLFAIVSAVLTAVTAIPTPAPSSNNVVLQRRADSIVLMLGADAGQNGGNGINNLQCQQGKLTTTINLQAAINVNNIHAYQPMGEIGLPVVTMSFFLDGNPGQVTVQNTFNVLTSMAQGNQWIFGLQDDGPHPGGQLSIGTCTPGAALPQVTVSFSASPITGATGLPNGADGGPPVPAVNGPVTVANMLPPQFQANGGGNVVAPAPAPAPATTTMVVVPPAAAGTVTVTTTVFVTSTITVNAPAATNPPATNGGGNLVAPPPAAAAATVTHKVAPPNVNGGWCTNGMFTTQLNLMVSSVTPSIPNTKCGGSLPMAECGNIPIVASITKNGAPVQIVSYTGHGFDANNAPVAAVVSGNTFTVTEGDDQPYYGGSLTLAIPCDYAANPPSTAAQGLAFAFAAGVPTAQLTTNNGLVTANVVVM